MDQLQPITEPLQKPRPDWEERRRIERAFAETDLGKRFFRYENLHASYWQLGEQDSVSDKRLRKAHEACEAARREFLDALLAIYK